METNDSGRTWTPANAPAAHAANGRQGGGVAEVRFADAMDGWVYGPDLWATHDGGATWHQVELAPSASGPGLVNDLEASAGQVHAAIFSDNVGVDLESAPVGSDAWRQSPTVVPFGAGPVPQATLTLNGTVGWVIEDDRTVIGGARLRAGEWSSWQPPCTAAEARATMAAASPTRLVAICEEGVYRNGPSHVRVYFSSDAGNHFTAAVAQPQLADSQGAANPSPGVVVLEAPLSSGAQLTATFDGGRTWSSVYQSTAGGSTSADLGFTTPNQGLVIISDVAAGTGQLLMTFDAGHHWAPVAFP